MRYFSLSKLRLLTLNNVDVDLHWQALGLYISHAVISFMLEISCSSFSRNDTFGKFLLLKEK